MDEALADELRALRARAYGPAPDILTDPAAHSRLVELEDLARPVSASSVRRGARGSLPRSTTPHVEHRESAPEGASPPPPPDATEDATGLADDADNSGEKPDEPWWVPWATAFAKLPRAAWAVSLVAVACLSAAVTWTLASQPIVSPVTGAQQIATLTPNPAPDPSAGEAWLFGPDQAAATFEYFGYSLTVAENTGFVGEEECLVVYNTSNVMENGQGIDGQVYYGCRAGVFPATVEFVIQSEGYDPAPDEAQAQFAEGTALQFVWDGEHLAVYAADPVEDTIDARTSTTSSE